jgi:hypothetical protein
MGKIIYFSVMMPFYNELKIKDYDAGNRTDF